MRIYIANFAMKMSHGSPLLFDTVKNALEFLPQVNRFDQFFPIIFIKGAWKLVFAAHFFHSPLYYIS
jgi:hypothetical protein